ncbi:replication regulatory protein RepA [Erwinia amylovora]
MSHVENANSSSSDNKRPYRKGRPLSPSERQQALVARKKETHKEIRVFVRNAEKSNLQRLCEAKGLTQSEMIENLIRMASQQLDDDVTE